MAGMPSRVFSSSHFCTAFTNEAASRAGREPPPAISLGRATCPMPAPMSACAFAGSKRPCASWISRLRFQIATSCATFSSSVIRDRRSLTRASADALACRYSGAGPCASSITTVITTVSANAPRHLHPHSPTPGMSVLPATLSSVCGPRRTAGLGGDISNVVPLPVLEPIEVCRQRCAGKVLTCHTHERAGEVGQAWCRGFVGENAGIEQLRQPLPRGSADAVGEVQSFVVHVDAQLDRHAISNGNWRREGVGGHLVGQRRHDAQMLTAFVARDVEIMKLAAVVVADQSCHLLEVLWLEL